MPYILKVKGDFAAAHALRGYEGACERVHGHNFKIAVGVSAERLNDIGISIDFRVLNRLLNKILEYFDHSNLNELEEFAENNATAENIAKLIYERLDAEVVALGGRLDSVTVEESAKYAATFIPKR